MILYRLSAAAARQRALAGSGARAITSLAPIVLALVLLRRLGPAPGLLVWAVVGALAVLVAVRSGVGYASSRRGLEALRVTADEDALHVAGLRGARSLPRARIVRIVDVPGSLGGLRVEAEGGRVVSLPRGGEAWGELRAHLERWRSIDRRGRLGRGARIASGIAVVAAIFFLPFLLDDLVARSKVVAAVLVSGTWLAMRAALRNR